MKKKALLSSLLTIALCFSLIAGSTYALFTSTSEINVAATSGTVSVQANILESTLETSSFDVAQAQGTFECGGTAKFDGDRKLNLDNVIPGDSAKFTIRVTNNSNVTVQYRVKWAVEGELAGALVATAGGNKIGTSIAAWEVWNIPASEDEKVKDIEIVVSLPEDVGNDYQNKSASITFIVEAVQGNAEVFNDTNEEAPVQTEVNAQTGKTETVAPMSVSANGFTAEIPAGTALEEGATTATLVITKEEANTGNFTVAGAESIGLNISIPEVADDNEAAIKITLTDILEPGPDGTTYPNGVMLYHKGELMTEVGSLAEVDEDGEFFYDAATGAVTLATDSFSNFTMLVAEKVATEAELTKAINAGKSVIFKNGIELTQTLLIKNNVIIDLNGQSLGGTVKSYENHLLQSQSNAAPHVVITSSKSGATINAGDKGVILGYGKTEFYNVAVNVGTVKSSSYTPFNVRGDLTLGAGVTVQVDYLGTSLISNPEYKIAIAIDGAQFNISEFNVNSSHMISVNNATSVAINGAEFNVKLTYNPTFPPYFVKPANATIENTSFNVTDTTATKAYTFNESYKWVEAGVAVATQAELVAAIEAAGADALTLVLVDDLALDADTTITVGAGKNVTLDLNGHTVTGVSDLTGANRNMFDVRGAFTVKNGTLTIEHVGDNMGWNNSTNVFNVTAGGVLNIENATVKNLGGSDMGFCVHLNNWGEVTLNADNVVFESGYVAVRVFNSGNDKNNVTLTDCTLKGASNAFWVHNYTVQDHGTVDKALTQRSLLNFDIDESNTLVGNPEKAGPVRYGFTGAIYCNIADGLPEIG